MPVVVRDGADLYWEKIGAGPALILGAGLNGSGKWWDPNRFALAERFTVYTFDQRWIHGADGMKIVRVVLSFLLLVPARFFELSEQVGIHIPDFGWHMANVY